MAEALERVVSAFPSGGERRTGQQAMAEAVARSIESGRHLIVQAGTGTGKGLAYLVPSLLSGRRVVVSTATKALQDQLSTKDLPFLEKHLGHKVSFAVLKGRSNYFCRQRAKEVLGGGDDDQLGLEELDVAEDATVVGRQVVRLVEWARTTASGDRADLPFEPTPRAWSSVSVSAMECPGVLKCPSGDECFAEAARLKAEAADVVVVNTHLYGAHLASGRNVIPPHEVVIFDEAHELEDIASSSLGLELTAGRFRALAFAIRRLRDEGAAAPIFDIGGRFDAAFDPARGERLLRGRDDVERFLDLASQRVRDATAELRKVETDDAAKARTLQAAGHLAGDIDFVRNATDGQVVWVEGAPGSPVVKIAPIDVGAALVEHLWDPEEGDRVTAVLTSATIPVALGARLGLDSDDYDALDVGSPFDFEENGLLYCAAHLPDPRAPGYEAAMHAELIALIEAARGRTLALFTSWRAMHAAATEVAAKVSYRVLTQSDLPKPALLREFNDDESACLFATMGFWQGVDIPGESLSQVVIDKLPFARPDEPLLQARRQRAGPAAFRLIDLPRAATLLAQGAGRLIRSHTDRGVVAVLDSRLAKANYRWDLVNALPPMRRTRDIADVVSFFSGQ
ncbi:MAG: ATP-dependent DNA helicase [Actinobacteria bacterium]|nr:ATP-dependent DNA helicase [Actinomycetota bacterium]